MLIRRTGSIKPPRGYILDRGHNYARNLMAFIPFADPVGNPVEIVTGGMSVTNVGTVGWGQSANGITRTSTTGSEIIPSFDIVPVASSLTIITLTAVSNTSPYIACKGATVAGVFLGEWGLIKNSSSQFRFKWGSNGTITGSTSMGTGRHFLCAQILGGATTGNLWIDKTSETPSGNITLSNNSKPLLIGGISDNAGGVDASFRASPTMELLAWWNRYLSNDEIIEFQNYPWQMLVPSTNKRYFYGTSVAFNASWAKNANSVWMPGRAA